MIHLVDIDGGNWRTPLKVAASQARFVADCVTILARAYAYREARSRACLICDGETPVGMCMYHDDEDGAAYIFSELLIDEQYQSRGYGKAATKLVLDCMRDDGRYDQVVLCYIEGNEAAKRLYEGYGFVETDRDEDEIIMTLKL